MKTNLAQYIQIGTFMSMMITGFLWLDSRHDAAHSSTIALIDAKIYTQQLEIKSLNSVLAMYNAKEEINGELTTADYNRRNVIRSQRQGNIDEVSTLASLRADIIRQN